MSSSAPFATDGSKQDEQQFSSAQPPFPAHSNDKAVAIAGVENREREKDVSLSSNLQQSSAGSTESLFFQPGIKLGTACNTFNSCWPL